MNKRIVLVLIAIFFANFAYGQKTAEIDFVSIGRAAPLAADANDYPFAGSTMRVMGATGSFNERPREFTGSAEPGETPAGIEPLERDIFTSDDFYADRDLWMDPRYFRCNTSGALEDIWGGNRRPLVGDNPSGNCCLGLLRQRLSKRSNRESL